MASIEKRGKNSYRLVVEGGLGAEGKRVKHYRTVKCRNKTEAGVELAKFVVEIETGTYVAPEKTSLGAFIPKWKELTDTQKLLAPKTLLNYEDYYNNHIAPIFGHMKLSEIKTIQILEFFKELAKPGKRKNGDDHPLASGTIEFIYRSFSNILARAHEWGFIKVNPIKGVKKPKAEYKKAQVFEKDEAEQIIAAIMEKLPLMWQCYYLGSLIGGYRRGELVGLQRHSVFFDHDQIYVQSSISLTRAQKAYDGPPKTNASIDVVDMPKWYMELLKRWDDEWLYERAQRIEDGTWEGGKNEYVFHAGKGKPIFFTYPSNKWSIFLEKNGFRHVPLHSLRHTMVSLLLEDDVPLEKIQKRVRHKSSQTTTDIYAHLTKKAGKEMASSFDSLSPFKKSVPNPSPEQNEEHATLH